MTDGIIRSIEGSKRVVHTGDRLMSPHYVHHVLRATEQWYVLVCESSRVLVFDRRRGNGKGLMITEEPVDCMMCMAYGPE